MHTIPTADTADAEAAAMPFPIFVFGTLRPGHGNDRLWRGRARDQYDGDCYVTGFRLVGRGFPYPIPEEGAETVGALIVPEPEQYELVLAWMDDLEGVPHHYTRDLVVVTTPEGYRVAWMYVTAIDLTDHRGARFPVPTDANGRYDWAAR
jgi:gamma-glutamylcyclotransferase (GGCT)/AIG2-like uncharacterized protein YtfP